MRLSLTRGALALLASVSLLSCTETPIAPNQLLTPNPTTVAGAGQIVISQIYGGGGNAGATYKNDFVELHNIGTAAVTVDGWTVQYASSTGTFATTTAATLSGTIQPGQYYLVQFAAGSGGTVNLPTPDASGTAAMSLSAGKIALTTGSASAGSGCPAVGGAIVDLVGFGPAGSCGANSTPTLSNTTAAIRLDDGCTYTGNPANDFVTGAPTPRNSASPVKSCQPAAEPASVTIDPASATVDVDASVTFSASALDANGDPTAATFSWSSDNTAVATINSSTGVATGVTVGTAIITVETQNGVTNTAAIIVEEPPPPPTLPDTRFSEIHYDNFDADMNEAIEVEGPAGTDLTGWSIVLYNGSGGASYTTSPLSGTIAEMCDGRGVVYVAYPSNGIQNGSPDGFALVDNTGDVVEFLSYEGVFVAADGPAVGMTSTDIGNSEVSAPVGQSLRRTASNTWITHSANFGACGDDAVPPPPNSISFTGREAGVDLPVGFEDQLFATEKEGATGNDIVTTFTWTSETPAIASVDSRGVVRGLSAGNAVIRATATDGTTGTFAIEMYVATANPAASYLGNTEFGDPVDSDASDDFIIRRAEFTTSFNNTRGIPNWVSYNLEAPHMVSGADRCDCFTFDPELETAGFARYTTADYTGAGAFHGYGIDRGHLVRSFDRTSGTLDNANTYYFANIIPQAAHNNQGPWAAAETYLGNLASSQNKELYVIAGASGSKGTVKDEGRITIPTYTWKVAVVMDRDRGLADIDGLEDLEVVALIMPNDSGIRFTAWETYKTTVDAVEALSGYDVLSLLADQIEIAVESDTEPPVASTDGPYTSAEGAAVSLSGASSSDPDGDALTYSWDLGDGSSATGDAVTHTYAQDGTYTVTLTVTDSRGLTNLTTTTATVGNVAPSVSAFDGATLLPGETYTAAGTFSDPGADPWSATADYGDGSGASALSLSGMSFSLSHTYAAAGSYTVTVAVSDDDATSSNTTTVTVLTHTQAIDDAIQLINQLVADGRLANGRGTSLKAKLNAAKKYVATGKTADALTVLQSTLDEIDALVRAGRLGASDAAALRTLVQRIIDSIA